MAAVYRAPPSPRPFWRLMDFNEHAPQVMYDIIKRYGDACRWRGFITFHFVNHPDYVRRVLSPSFEQYSKDVIDYRVLAQIMGNGLVSNDREHWVKQRKLMQPMFANRVVNQFDEPINRLTTELIESWTPHQADEPIWIDREMHRLAFRIVGATLFGANIDEYASEVAEILEVVNLRTQDWRALMTLWPALPTPHNRKWRRAKARLDEIVYQMIAERRAQGAQENDILSRLINARDEHGQAMDEQQMRDEVVTLMLAGHETSATALTWTMYLLAQHKDVEARLFEDLDSVLSGRQATSADLSKLPYLKQVAQEAMRIYPPVWAIARRSHQDEVFGDVLVPAKSYVGIVQYALHRHPEFWPDPERFDPERFDPVQAQGRHSYAYVPFAAGPRACIGLGMAMLEIQLVLAQIAQRFRFDVVPGHPIETRAAVTLRPKYGMPLLLTLRH